jgi:hypothetical protein
VLVVKSDKDGKGGVGLLIGIGPKPKEVEEPAEDGGEYTDDDAALASAEALMTALNAMDAQGVVEAFRLLKESC